MSSDGNYQVPTLAIHGGRSPDTHAEAVVFPIFQTATFEQQEVSVTKGHSYSRVSNPTVDALERAIGALEGTPQAVCFRTGMAAVTTLFLVDGERRRSRHQSPTWCTAERCASSGKF